jgi:hypothetical protein
MAPNSKSFILGGVAESASEPSARRRPGWASWIAEVFVVATLATAVLVRVGWPNLVGYRGHRPCGRYRFGRPRHQAQPTGVEYRPTLRGPVACRPSSGHRRVGCTRCVVDRYVPVPVLESRAGAYDGSSSDARRPTGTNRVRSRQLRYLRPLEVCAPGGVLCKGSRAAHPEPMRVCLHPWRRPEPRSNRRGLVLVLHRLTDC